MTPERAKEPIHEVKRAKGYNSHPSGVETKDVTRYLSGILGSAVKYVWRAGLKGDLMLDLKKAAWCFGDEAERLAEDGGGFAINGKWIEPARQVLGAQFHGRPMTVGEELLMHVMTTLLLSTLPSSDPGTHPRHSVLQCQAIVQGVIDKLEAAQRAPQPDFVGGGTALLDADPNST